MASYQPLGMDEGDIGAREAISTAISTTSIFDIRSQSAKNAGKTVTLGGSGISYQAVSASESEEALISKSKGLAGGLGMVEDLNDSKFRR